MNVASTEALSGLRGPTLTFTFRKPLLIHTWLEEDVPVAECIELGIFSFGDPGQLLLDAIAEDFEAQWRFIASAPDEQLTPDAQARKRQMLDLVEQAALRS